MGKYIIYRYNFSFFLQVWLCTCISQLVFPTFNTLLHQEQPCPARSRGSIAAFSAARIEQWGQSSIPTIPRPHDSPSRGQTTRPSVTSSGTRIPHVCSPSVRALQAAARSLADLLVIPWEKGWFFFNIWTPNHSCKKKLSCRVVKKGGTKE